jgi:hypothetical protein
LLSKDGIGDPEVYPNAETIKNLLILILSLSKAQQALPDPKVDIFADGINVVFLLEVTECSMKLCKITIAIGSLVMYQTYLSWWNISAELLHSSISV